MLSREGGLWDCLACVSLLESSVCSLELWLQKTVSLNCFPEYQVYLEDLVNFLVLLLYCLMDYSEFLQAQNHGPQICLVPIHHLLSLLCWDQWDRLRQL